MFCFLECRFPLLQLSGRVQYVDFTCRLAQACVLKFTQLFIQPMVRTIFKTLFAKDNKNTKATKKKRRYAIDLINSLKTKGAASLHS